MKSHIDILDLFDKAKSESRYLKVSAPMVRYSKLEFRQLLRIYGTELCFTPMIIADSFCRSYEARNNEFTTNEFDTPLVAQFAAKNSHEFATAAELIFPYVDGVDLNCGCPQKWAIAKGYGCALLKNPQLLHEMIRELRNRIPSNAFSCSYKIRLLQTISTRSTIELCRQLEATGLTFLTVHGRAAWQKNTEPVNVQSLCDLKQSLTIPLIYNGNIKTLSDANVAFETTNCDGIMAARGLLTNPTLFSENSTTTITTLDCIQNWCNLAVAADSQIQFQTFHHHLTFMLEKLMNRKLRSKFNEITSKEQIYEFLQNHFNEFNINKFMFKKNLNCDYNENVLLEFNKKNLKKTDYESKNDGGKFYNLYKNNLLEKCQSDDDINLLNTSLFDL